MGVGDYVQDHQTGDRGTVMARNDNWLVIYSPQLGALKELWMAPESQLVRLLRKEDIGNV